MRDSGFSPGDAFALGKGLLYGDDSAFSSGFREVIASAGVTHLVAASGANLAYVLLFPQRLLGSRNRLLYQVVSFTLIWFYWSLAEQSGSLWRAMGMWLLTFVAACFGRSSLNGWILLLWTAICFLWFRDRLFTHSYFLSSLAILGLVFSQFLKSGENNIAVIMHSKKRMYFWMNLLKRMWFEGSAIFVAVEMYLWLNFQSFEPTGIYTTIFLQPFLPVYLCLSGSLEFILLLIEILPGAPPPWLLGVFVWISGQQKTVFQFLLFVIRKMAEVSRHRLWENSVLSLLIFFFVVLGFRAQRFWQRRKRLERWRRILDFTN